MPISGTKQGGSTACRLAGTNSTVCLQFFLCCITGTNSTVQTCESYEGRALSFATLVSATNRKKQMRTSFKFYDF